jgi:farnesyl diphosphate synthase
VSDFQNLLKQRVQLIEQAASQMLASVDFGPMGDPMRYAVLNGGKRLRGFLAIESANLFDVDMAQALHAAVAIECIHAYSLVHDDLPAMDDDDLRRGKPTVHKKWDDATAVLTGDALQSEAFRILSLPSSANSDAIRVDLILSLSQAAGAMVIGQAQDIAAETADIPLTLNGISTLQANKTGALIEWSAMSGAMLAGVDTSRLRSYATALGKAFQIQDDVLDVEGNPALAGKRLQKDADAGKATFVSLLGLGGAKARAAELIDTACSELDAYGQKADPLRQVAQFVINRNM